MTFNACIKKHFDEAFGPYGFKKIKSKYPYWGRMVGDEILQIITYKNEWSMKPYKNFSIWGGVATVYRKKIDLDIESRDQTWMKEAGAIYQMLNNCEYNDYDSNNSFNLNSEIEMENRIINAIDITVKGLLQELQRANDLKSSIDFWAKYTPQLLNILDFDDFDKIRKEDEGFILFKEYGYEDYRAFEKKQYEDCTKLLLKMYSQYGQRNENEYYEYYRRDCLMFEKDMVASLGIFKKIKESNTLNKKINIIADEFKGINIKYLTDKGML